MDDDAGGSMSPVVPFRRDYSQFRPGADDAGQADMFPGAPMLWHEDDAWLEADIPRRPWVVPGYLMREAVTVLSGPGAAGKSMLTVAWATSLALGRRFSRFRPPGPLRVLIYNVEDDRFEQRRRFSAVLREINHTPGDIAGQVMRVGPEQIGTLLRRDPVTNRLVETGAMRHLVEIIEQCRPDVVFLDPFVELHDSEENDNTAIRSVMARLRQLARDCQCAVCVLHHARKGIAGMAGDPDSLRGASAIVGAARVVLTVMVMDAKEAEKLAVPPEDRFRYFRLDGAKSNYAPIEDAEWFQRVEHRLDNGDGTAAAVAWTPPSPLREVPVNDLITALQAIDRGPTAGVLYTGSKKGGADRWAGVVLQQACEMNEAQARITLAAWLRSGLLHETTFRHPVARREMRGVRVDFSKQPTASNNEESDA